MANKLICRYGRGHLHFITFTCIRLLPLLRSVPARNVFVQMIGEVRDPYGFRLLGYIVMAEHLHILFASGDVSLARFWQRRSYDFNDRKHQGAENSPS